ncbi:extracellular solute-binding protein [Roseibium sp. Sym1]|uniref:extracellular solute-binding protein n=1 Tax=Roseibium sp. Sym1 TaxID=3016006 RepID=UPI0022B2CBD2|nr:extracellular solute-binding protein [Roseibium sp. Sym1]
MSVLNNKRRHLGKLAAGALALTLFAGQAMAEGSIVVANFPNNWEDAYRKVIKPILAEQEIDLTIAPALTTLQIGNTLAAKKAGAPPPYDALLLSPGDTAVAIDNDLIMKIDPSKLKNWDKLDPMFQTEYGPVVTVEFCGIGYNPDLVPAPSGYKVLFEDPAYKGLVSLGGLSNTEIMAFSEIARIFGDGPLDMDAVFELIKEKKDHLGPFVDTTTHQMTMFQQNEIGVFMACTNNVAKLQSLGVNAEFVAPETGMPAVPVVIHMTKGNADPDAVYAYMDAAISAQAQSELTAPPVELFPTNSDVELTDSIKRFVTKDKVGSFVYLDWVSVAKNRDEWTKAYDRAVKQ